MMSNTPIRASMLAASTSGMPWSIEAGMRCVPTRPLVVAPQMKKLAASSQKVLLRAPVRRPSSAAPNGFFAGAGVSSTSPAPYAVSPTSRGLSLISTATTGTAEAVASHERGGEGAAEPEQQEVDGDRRRDHGRRPAELPLQRDDQHPGRGADSRRRQQREEGHAEDDPRVVDATPGQRDHPS